MGNVNSGRRSKSICGKCDQKEECNVWCQDTTCGVGYCDHCMEEARIRRQNSGRVRAPAKNKTTASPACPYCTVTLESYSWGTCSRRSGGCGRTVEWICNNRQEGTDCYKNGP